MQNRFYIPGFDWIRLLGCMLIALSHAYLNPLAQQLVPAQVLAVLGEVVPMFFLMSGFLMCRSLTFRNQPFRYVMRYFKRYSVLFIALCFLNNLRVYFQIYTQTNVFYFKSFVADMLLLPFYSPPLIQLWFIPPLLVGIGLNSYIYLKHLEDKILPYLVVYVLVIMGWHIYGGYFAHLSPVQSLTSWKYFRWIDYFIFHSAWGILYVFIGMWIFKNQDIVHRIKLRLFLLPLMIITAAELFLMFSFSNPISGNLGLNITSCMWSTFFFLGILRIKGNFLEKYHVYISLFSGLMYFLHMSQQFLLKHWTEDGILIFLIITAVNAMLTAAIVKIKCLNNSKVKNGL